MIAPRVALCLLVMLSGMGAGSIRDLAGSIFALIVGLCAFTYLSLWIRTHGAD